MVWSIFKKWIGLELNSTDYLDIDALSPEIFDIEMFNKKNKATVVNKPFYDPKKKLASS